MRDGADGQLSSARPSPLPYHPSQSTNALISRPS